MDRENDLLAEPQYEPVPTYEELYSQSHEIGKLAGALAAAQGEMAAAPKDKDNPFFHSKYADLASVIGAARQPLAKHELAVTQMIASTDGTAVIVTQLMHSSGEWVRSVLKMKPVKPDPQGLGSAITYGRRYAFAGIVGIASEEDDDGNAASDRKAESKAAQEKVVAEKLAAPRVPVSKAGKLLDRIAELQIQGQEALTLTMGDAAAPEWAARFATFCGHNGTTPDEWVKLDVDRLTKFGQGLAAMVVALQKQNEKGAA